MKKIYMMMMLVLAGMMAVAQTSVWNGGRTVWSRGAGTESDPYLLESAEHLAYLAYVVNKGCSTEGKYFKLTTDIDLNGNEDQPWMPIGLGSRWFNDDGCNRGNNYSGSYYDDESRPVFCGHFDGGDHFIYNIYLDGGSNLGLFGSVQGTEDAPAVIENVFVASGFIRGYGYCGGIVGVVNGDVLISRCWNGVVLECEGGMSTGVGGIVGHCMTGNLHIQKCYNIGNVSGFTVGGVLGGGGAEIEECYNKGDISGTYAGGIYGAATRASLSINNSYNLGNITANTEHGDSPGGAPVGPAAGGIAGVMLLGAQSVTITNCYNAGGVSSTGAMGCIMAFANQGIFENNYFINTCSDNSEDQGAPLNEEYMHSQEFVDALNAGNRNPIWAMDEDNVNDGFPILTELNLSINETSTTVFKVYPNPAQGQFVVDGSGTVIVRNLLGQTLMTCEIEGPALFALPQGMYFVTLGKATQKIVVK